MFRWKPCNIMFLFVILAAELVALPSAENCQSLAVFNPDTTLCVFGIGQKQPQGTQCNCTTARVVHMKYMHVDWHLVLLEHHFVAFALHCTTW